MKEVPTLSVVINTKNSEAYLEKALKSAALADEIVVVDMHSTDKTKSIAKKYTQHVFSYDDVGYVEPARNYAISKATSDWIFILDADEEITPGLERQIKEILIDPEFDAYYVPRSNEVFGYEMRKTGWWPDHQLRLFRQGVVSWSDEIHSVPKISGTSEYLPANPQQAILHHNYQSLSQFVDRMNRYTTIEATNPSDTEIDTVLVIESFKDEFFRRMFQHQGVSEGMHGVSLSFLQSMYEVLVILKMWEQRGFPQSTSNQKRTLKALGAFQNDLAYWIHTYEIKYSTGFANVLARIKRKVRTLMNFIYAH